MCRVLEKHKILPKPFENVRLIRRHPMTARPSNGVVEKLSQWDMKQSISIMSINTTAKTYIGGFTPFMPRSGLQEIPVATRQESGVLFFPSRFPASSVLAREGAGCGSGVAKS